LALVSPNSEAQQSTSARATAATAPAPEASGALEEIVVTSTKRAENPREVPISIAVLQAQDLQDAHIVELSDLARSTSGLGFTASGSVGGSGPGLGNIEIRGVSSTAGQATTGIYLDDTPMIVRNFYSLGAAEPKYFDIDRIEVLRGPQGTLYGASSLGGTIRIVSNQPDARKTEEIVYAELSNTRGGQLNYQANAIANIPLVPNKAAIRFGVQIGENDGYIDRHTLQLDSGLNPSAGNLLERRANTDIWEVAKLSAMVQVTDQLTVTPSIFYQRERTGDANSTSLFLPGSQIAKNTAEPGEDTLGTATLDVKYDLGMGDLTSATSFFYRDFTRTQDGQAENSEYLTFLTVGVPQDVNTAIANLPSGISLSSNVRHWTEELRIASKAYDGLTIDLDRRALLLGSAFQLYRIRQHPGHRGSVREQRLVLPRQSSQLARSRSSAIHQSGFLFSERQCLLCHPAL
jgi:outer membrane receptor protein involved in Fe transport